MDIVGAGFGGVPCRCGFAEAEALGRDGDQGVIVNEEFKGGHTVRVGGMNLNGDRC